jgi:DNA polymerase-3 subunit delta
MAHLKAHQVEGWLKRPDPSVSAVLVYGPDRGMVSERARAFARMVAPDLDDPFNVLKIDASDIEADPGRLHDEAATVSLFGGDRLIWISGAGTGRKLAEALDGACEIAGAGVRILIEAGDLKKGNALRTATEGLAKAIALPCYNDEGRDLDRLIDTMFEAARTSIALDARTALKASIGGDRLASRGEIEKLLLYAAGQPVVTLDDVLASAGDSASVSADDAVDALLGGKLAELDIAFQRHCRSGAKAFLLASAALRQFQSLQLMRHDMDRDGKSAAAIVAAQKPPVFFTRKALMERAVTKWTGPMIARALERLQAAILESRRQSDLDEAVIRQALLAVALDGVSAGRR